MAATRKSAKRTAGKKGSAKRPSTKRQPVRKASSKRRTKRATGSKATGLRRKAQKGLKAARGGLKTVRRVGKKTWKTLKSRTAQVMEGMKETLSSDD